MTTAAAALPVASTAQIEIALRPRYDASLQAVRDVEVTLVYRGIRFDPERQLLQMPLSFDNCETIAETLEDILVSDDEGLVRLHARNLEGRDMDVKAWFGNRPVHGALRVKYRAPVTNNTGSRGAAAPLELRNDARAVSGSGGIFLLLPPSNLAVGVSLLWDLRELPDGSIAVSSLGRGDVAPSAPLTFSQLLETYYMAGMLGTTEAQDAHSPFFAAWQGEPPYAAAVHMSWSERLYRSYADFFRTPPEDSYGIFIRFNPVNGGGGRECHRSFLITYNERSGDQPNDLRSLISHEMFHTFSPMLNRPQTVGENLAYADRWFFEGLAVYYQTRFPWLCGMIDDEEFIADVNFHAARYYSSVMANLPNDAVGEKFWKDTRVRTLVYDRGMLYFASVNEAIMSATGGARSLDDLILEMVEMERQGLLLTGRTWESLADKYLGSAAVAAFHAFLAGETPLPGSAAFGPRFSRTTRMVRRYELGFEPAVLTEPGRRIRGLVPGSAAEKAGLRDGDAIVHPVPQDRIQGTQDMRLELVISRSSETLKIAYLPRGDTVSVHQWKLAC